MVFRMQVNGNRFQQGRYMLTYIPTGGERSGPGTNGNNWANLHFNTLKCRSQLPHVEIDVNCDTEAILKIPFNSALDFYNVNNLYNTALYGNWGFLQLTPYVNINAVANSTANFTIFAHFEDVELVGQTLPIVAQSGGSFRGGKSNSEKEAAKKNVGPVESTALSISTIASNAMSVPLLSAYAGPIKWASDIVASTASTFGWAAPQNLEPVTRVQRTMIPYFTNVDKVDQSLPLSLTSANAIDVLPGFSGTNIDELDIVKFAGIQSYFNTIPWLTNQASGVLLTSCFLYPGAFKSTRTYLTQTVVDHTPLSYLGDKFSYWRGSISLTIKFVKTEFHSGRLAVCFLPYDQKGVPNANMSYANSEFLHRDIIDIREQNEVTFTFPYTSPLPYLQTAASYGVVYVYVVDPLVAPNTVPDTINLILESAGCKDIEFSILSNTAMVPAVGITAQSASPFDRSDCTLVSKEIGSTTMSGPQLDTSKACIGEKITSLRQLMKRFYTYKQRGTPAAIVDARYAVIAPFAFAGSRSAPSTDSAPPFFNDFYGELCSMFMYSRGGVRFKFLPYSNVTVDDLAVTLNTGVSGSTYTYPALVNSSANPAFYGGTVQPSWLLSASSTVIVNKITDHAIEFQVPQYSFTHSRNNASHMACEAIPYTISPLTLTSNVMISAYVLERDGSSTATVGGTYMRAGADDCNLGGFVSIPPMVYTHS